MNRVFCGHLCERVDGIVHAMSTSMNTVYTIADTFTPGKRLVQTYSFEADAIRDCAIVNRWEDRPGAPRYQVERSVLVSGRVV